MKRQQGQRGAALIEWLLLAALVTVMIIAAYSVLFSSAPSTRTALADRLDADNVELRGEALYVATFPGDKLCVGRYTGEGASAKPSGEPRCVMS